MFLALHHLEFQQARTLNHLPIDVFRQHEYFIKPAYTDPLLYLSISNLANSGLSLAHLSSLILLNFVKILSSQFALHGQSSKPQQLPTHMQQSCPPHSFPNLHLFVFNFSKG